MSTPETPSTNAWCVFEISAKRPPSSPCTIQTSQSGFERSSRWGEVAQLLVAARLRQRGVTDVVAEVEVGVVHPERPPRLERREGKLLAVAGHAREARFHMGAEGVVLGRRPLEDHERAHVHVRCLLLLSQE
jgi:hypothetical protein